MRHSHLSIWQGGPSSGDAATSWFRTATESPFFYSEFSGPVPFLCKISLQLYDNLRPDDS